MTNGKIIRAGFTSNAYLAGTAQVMVQGTFTKEDLEDLLQQFEIVIRSIKRQGES